MTSHEKINIFAYKIIAEININVYYAFITSTQENK